MKKITSPATSALLALLILSAAGCTKSSSSSSNNTGPGPNGGAALTEEVLVGKNSANATLDSIVTQYQYNSAKYVSQVTQTSTAQDSGESVITTLTYNLVYSGNLISSLTGTYTQAVTLGNTVYNTSSQMSATFQASGGQIVSFIQTGTTTGTPFLPPTIINGNDSAVLTYDGSGNVLTYDIYLKGSMDPTYLPYSFQTYTYSGGNVASDANVIYVGGFPIDTFTTVNQFNNKVSAAPLYLFPGIAVSLANDLTQSTMTETGLNPNVVVSSYATTYNAANQPVSSIVTLTTTPANPSPSAPATELISYTYQ